MREWEPDHPAVIAWRQQCQHCHRDIVNRDGQWIDPQATGDDSLWREVCDSHDSFTAEHSPRPRTLAERTYAVRERRGLGHPTGAGRRVRLTAGFMTLFVASTLVEEALPAAVALLAVGALCVLPEMIGGNR